MYIFLPVHPSPCYTPVGLPSDMAAASTPEHKGEEEHHTSDNQYKVQHTPLCRKQIEEMWAIKGAGTWGLA